MHKGAGIVLISKDNKVLLNLRDGNPVYYKNMWSIIGGGVEDGEDPKEAAFRELKEETGYKANDLNFLTLFEYLHESGNPGQGHIYWTVYDEEQEIGCYEGLKMEWKDLEEIENLELITGQKEVIKKALEKYSSVD